MTLFDPVEVEIDPTKDYTAELVGPDKPYKTTADLARALLHKEQHIKRTETENAGMRDQIGVLSDDLKARTTLEELVTRVSKAPIESPSNVEPRREPDANQREEVDYDKLISDKIAQRETLAKRTANLETVTTRLRQEFGANTPAQLKSIAASLDMTPEELTDHASRNPTAFYRLIGLDAQPARQEQAPKPGVNTVGFKPVIGSEKGKTYFDALKQSDPRKYWSPAVQNEMHRIAEEMGYDVFKAK